MRDTDQHTTEQNTNEETGTEQKTAELAHRRSFFGRFAGLSALGLFGVAAATAARAQTVAGDEWPGQLPGRHKAIFDVFGMNDGFPLGFVNNFLTPNMSATAVMIFRHQGTPYAFNHSIWAKYKIGETFKIIDPETKVAAVKNPWFESKLPQTLDKLAARGVVMGVCNVATRGQSGRLAPNAGVSADEAYKDSPPICCRASASFRPERGR
jgi:hypothetical protein